MVSIFDVAARILDRCGIMPTMKLQRLAYYAQAASLSWRGVPLFSEDFQAWSAGPVCVPLYMQHRGLFLIEPGQLPAGNEEVLTGEECRIVDQVCARFGTMASNDLARRIQAGTPWQKARGNTQPGQSCTTIISKQLMREEPQTLLSPLKQR